MPNPNQSLQHFPKETADALDLHEKNIRLFAVGELKGAAEQFGYAYLLGRELLAAKETIPHGNSHNGDSANLGLKQWLAARFPSLPYRTAASRMEYARSVNDSKEAQAIFKRRPLLLKKGRLSVKDRQTFLQAVPLIMDGKGMMRFMRDSRLLRDPEKQRHHKKKKLSAEAAAAAKDKQAERFWSRLESDHRLGQKLLARLDAKLVQTCLDTFVATNESLRTLLKAESKS